MGSSPHGGDGAGLPGYVARPVTFHDLDAVEGFLIDVDVSSFGEAESSRIWLEEAWSSDWTDLPTMSRLVIAADGTAAGFADLEAVDPSKEIGAYARVHPRHLGRGLGAALVGWTRRTAARMVAPGRSVTLRHSIAGPDRAARRLLEREGFRHVRTAWHMRMDLPSGYAAGDPPPGVTIRPSVAGADDLAIWETMDAAFRTHFGFQPIGFERWWDNTRRAGTYDPSLILVAVLDERIVGASHQFTPPGGATGWVGDLGVRPEVQGRGIGRALLRHALADLARRGLRTAQLNVDSENQTGAVELYRSVGMGVHREWLDLDATIQGIGPV